MVSAAVKEHQVICVERKCTDVWIFEARCLKYFSKKKEESRFAQHPFSHRFHVGAVL